jgi:tripartite-type tricarboxylate transporter receptor subunit TctC
VVARMVQPGLSNLLGEQVVIDNRGGAGGLLAPAKTPRQIIARLHDTLVKVVRAPGLKSQFEVLGYDVVGSSPEEFAAFISADWAKNAKVVKLSGAKVD